MDTLKKIDNLFEQAANQVAQQDTPVFHVSEWVMAELMMDESPRLVPLSVFAGVSAAAAAVMLFLSVQAWNYLNSPLTELLTPIQETQLW